VEGLVVAGGFSSIGMVTAPAACRRLAEGKTELFEPARFSAL
jgi:glycine/D-amino acid oxidase-like deaminating enzyme